MKEEIYLDHSATTPLIPEVLKEMTPYFTENYGNPSGMHNQSRQIAQAISRSRRSIANILNCNPLDIIFTSGGTESDNLAIRGVAFKSMFTGKGKHIITSSIEHPAVSNTINYLCDHFDFTQTKINPDKNGIINPSDIEQAIQEDTCLVSIMYANNEIGTIQPINEIGKIAKEKNICFHSDAVQAGAFLSLDVKELNVDLLSLAAHKFYGPMGTGVLYVKDRSILEALFTGGAQEQALRPGTENTPGIIGIATALKIAQENRKVENIRLLGLREKLIDGILNQIETASLTGDRKQRLPGHASFVFKGIDANRLLMRLDMAGICASSGSACSTGKPKPSSTLLAIGISKKDATGALRLTLGKSNTEGQIEEAVEIICSSLKRMS